MPGARKPFWWPASSFYVFAAAVAIAVFFLVWGLLQETHEESPWIAAGLSASITLSGAVILREVVFRLVRNRQLERQKQLDRSLQGISSYAVATGRPNKLTIERNALVLREIRQKSEAARILSSMSSGHREVVDLCENYLAVNARELAHVGSGSPRLAALLRGKDVAEDLHRFHMLQWAEVEATSLSKEASSKAKSSEKIKAAGLAMSVLESALRHYPDDVKLNESAIALNQFIATVKVSELIEKAQKAAHKGNYKQAKKQYESALFLIDQHAREQPEGDLAVTRINEELAKIEQIDGKIAT